MTKGYFFNCILGAVGDNGKVYFCTEDVALASQRNRRSVLESATCHMKYIMNKCKMRPNAWVIEYSALLNLLKLEHERRLYCVFKFGHVKEIIPTDDSTSSSIHSACMPQIEECSEKVGTLFDSWIRDFKKKCSNEETENRLLEKKNKKTSFPILLSNRNLQIISQRLKKKKQN